MIDLIDRQTVMDLYMKWRPYMATRLHEFEKELKELPSVKPEQKIGQWIYYYTNGFGRQILKCSKCSFQGDALGFNYCPNCGAKMEGEE